MVDSIAEDAGIQNGLVTFQTQQGFDIQGTVLKLTRYLVVFEFYNPTVVLRTSEALAEFKIALNDQTVFAGNAVVTNLLNTGTMLVCEVNLDDGWQEDGALAGDDQALRQGLAHCVSQWERVYKIQPEFKVVVADMQMLLHTLRHWFEQVELSIRSQPDGNRLETELRAARTLADPAAQTVAGLFERFEATAASIDPDLRPVHAAYVKRQLHSLVLCAPFMYRTFQKPLGYAGDYEMVNMMTRDPFEGASLFAKVLNRNFLNTAPVLAHRNRLKLLTEQLVAESCRLARSNEHLKGFTIGCGPALEIQRYLAECELSHQAEFTLLDFNEETIQHAETVLHTANKTHGRGTRFTLIKKAVTQFLKEASKPASSLAAAGFNFVYCAGLFDYMPKHICKLLVKVFYQMLAPGGLVLVTNVDECNPNRAWMEYSVDWHLIYRNRQSMLDLVPPGLPEDQIKLESDDTGVNLFLEIRKPSHG